jgi:proteasome alpha subunit
MIEEPYRWLEAIGNRREYVHEQLKGGSPVFAASLPEGILLLGVGSGNSKVFELFDRHAMAGLGHPADIEKIRQAAIDAAHTEAFTRAPEDVSLRRLVGFGLSPQLKTNFEQIFSAPFLIELLLAEVGSNADQDLLFRLHFDGGFQLGSKGVAVATGKAEGETVAQTWLAEALANRKERAEAAEIFLQAWWCMVEGKPLADSSEQDRRSGWRSAVSGKVVEIGWLARSSSRPARYRPLSLQDLGLRTGLLAWRPSMAV